jgi:ABC-2 type transport system permease protein
VSTTSRIYDSGYRPYDGPRLGPAHTARALIAHTLRRVFGLHRPARNKVLPFLITLIGYVPPAVFVGLAAFLPKRLARDALPTYGDFYGYVSAVVLLFAMFVAPEAICPDRRSGMLSLYLAAPLTRARYLVSKAVAVGTALLFVTIGPPLLLLIGLSLQSAGPHGPGGLALVVVRILGTGLMMSAVYTALSLAVSSMTDRRAIAAAGMFIFVQATSAVTAGLVFGADGPHWILAFGLSRAPFELARRIYGLPPLFDRGEYIRTGPLVLALVGWVALATAIAWQRYRNLQVTR